MSNQLPIKQFFETDYVNYASYDNYRKIACYIDGLKPSARKVIHTVLNEKIKEPLKVARLGSRVAEKCAYIHGEASLYSVIIGLAQDMPGVNNLPLLKREGNFGTRLVPEAAAPRYIFTCKEDVLDKLFIDEDNEILIEQIFEGDKIEPKFFVPTLPLLLVNGSEGISSGFAQKILPRNVKDLKKWLNDRLTGKKSTVKLDPYFDNFKGSVKKTENGWEILGKVNILSSTELEIIELPVNYSLNQYINVLDDLEEKGTILSYKDLSSKEFKFNVKVLRKFTAGRGDYEILDDLKLIKRMTENFTCCNEDLAITEFKDQYEILEAYMKKKMEFLDKRKNNQLAKLKKELYVNFSRYLFIKNVVEDKIIVAKKSNDDVVKQITKIKDIRIGEDGTYNYLLNMPISSLTKEKMAKLAEFLKNLKAQYDDLRNKPVEKIWLEEIEKI